MTYKGERQQQENNTRVRGKSSFLIPVASLLGDAANSLLSLCYLKRCLSLIIRYKKRSLFLIFRASTLAWTSAKVLKSLTAWTLSDASITFYHSLIEATSSECETAVCVERSSKLGKYFKVS